MGLGGRIVLKVIIIYKLAMVAVDVCSVQPLRLTRRRQERDDARMTCEGGVDGCR